MISVNAGSPHSYGPLEKVACGAFSDINFASAGKRRDFCRLRIWGQRKSGSLVV
jgi:hypothetical protein